MDEIIDQVPKGEKKKVNPHSDLKKKQMRLPGRPPAAPKPAASRKMVMTHRIFIILSLCVLQAMAGFWIVQWKNHRAMYQDQLDNIRGEISDLRNLIHANVDEALISLKILVLNPHVPNETARQIAGAVYKYAHLYNRDPDLILAMMSVESAFDPQIESNMGAIGLMQIMPQWIRVLDIQCELKDPDCNTKYGLQILGAYEQLYDGLYMALTAYNRGPGPVDAALMKKRDPHNGYAEKIRTVYNRLRTMNRSSREIREDLFEKVVALSK